MRIVTIFSTVLLAVRCFAAPSTPPTKATQELNNAMSQTGETGSGPQSYSAQWAELQKNFDNTIHLGGQAVALLTQTIKQFREEAQKPNNPDDVGTSLHLRSELRQKYDQAMVAFFGNGDDIPGIFAIVKAFTNIANHAQRIEGAMKNDMGISEDQAKRASERVKVATERLGASRTLLLSAFRQFFGAFWEESTTQFASFVISLVKGTNEDDPQVLPANYQMFLGNMHGLMETNIRRFSDMWKKLTADPAATTGINLQLFHSFHKLMLEILYRTEWEIAMQDLAENSHLTKFSQTLSSTSDVAAQQITFGKEEILRGIQAYEGMLKQSGDLRREWEEIGVASTPEDMNAMGYNDLDMKAVFKLKYPLNKENLDKDEAIYAKIQKVTVADQLEIKNMIKGLFESMPQSPDLLYDTAYLQRVNQLNDRADFATKAYHSLWNSIPRFEKLRGLFLDENDPHSTVVQVGYFNNMFDDSIHDAIQEELHHTHKLLAAAAAGDQELTEDDYHEILMKTQKLKEAGLEMEEVFGIGAIDELAKRFKLLAELYNTQVQDRLQNEEKDAKRKKNQEKRTKRKGKKAAEKNAHVVEQTNILEPAEKTETEALVEDFIKHEEPSIPEVEVPLRDAIGARKETGRSNEPAVEEEAPKNELIEEMLEPEAVETREPEITEDDVVLVDEPEPLKDLVTGDDVVNHVEETMEVTPIPVDDDKDWIPVKAKERGKEKPAKDYPFRRKYGRERTDSSVEQAPKKDVWRKQSDKAPSQSIVFDDKNQFGSQSSPSHKKYGRTSTGDYKSFEKGEIPPPNSQLWPPLIQEEVIATEKTSPVDKVESKGSILEDIPEVEDLGFKEDKPAETIVPEDANQTIDIPSEKFVDPAIIEISSPIEEATIPADASVVNPAIEKAENLVSRLEAGLRSFSQGPKYAKLMQYQGKRIDMPYIATILNPVKRDLGEAKLWLDAANKAVSTILDKKAGAPHQQRIDELRAKWLATNLSYMKYARVVGEAEEKLNTALVAKEAKRLDDLREAILENVSEIAQGHEQLWEQTKVTRRAIGDTSDVAAHFMNKEAIERVEKNAESIKRDREILKQIMELTKKLGKPPGEQ